MSSDFAFARDVVLLPSIRLASLSEADVAERAGVSGRTVRRWLASATGSEPGAPTRTGKGSVRFRWSWSSATVDRWIAAVRLPPAAVPEARPLAPAGTRAEPAWMAGRSLADIGRHGVGKTGHGVDTRGRDMDTRRKPKK